MSRFFSKAGSGIAPYTPGEQPQDMKYIKLNTNESPYPPSEKAVKLTAAAAEKLNLYPDPTCATLTSALAKTYGVGEDEIIWGNGSDEILFFAFSAFCSEERGAVYPDITYGFYDAVARLCGVPTEKIPLRDDLSIDIADFANAGKTVFIANPNAPTGIALPLSDIETLLKTNPDSVVIVDEAYVDFGGESAVSLIGKYDNLLVVQTFSKSRSMAGARLGMGFGSAELIRDLNAIKYSLNPYNINKMTLAAGVGILEDGEYFRSCCGKIMSTRAYTEEKLTELGFTYPKSSANFIFAKHPRLSGEEVYLKLKSRGILVRYFASPRISDYVRITVGTPEQMDALISALGAILEETK